MCATLDSGLRGGTTLEHCAKKCFGTSTKINTGTRPVCKLIFLLPYTNKGRKKNSLCFASGLLKTTNANLYLIFFFFVVVAVASARPD